MIQKSFPFLICSPCSTTVPFSHGFTSMVSVTLVNSGPEADDPPSDKWSEGQQQPNTTS